MAQPKRVAEPRLTLRLNSRTSFADDLSYFGRIVGPRRGPNARDHLQKESYCLRRWLLAMLGADRLDLPVTIEAPPSGTASPDFVLRWDDGRPDLGVEVSEAGHASWQQWLTETESDETALMSGDGYVGDPPERQVVQDVVEVIAKKARLHRDGKYSATASCDLLIYENSEGGFLSDRQDVIARLGRNKASMASDIAQFRQIHLIFGEEVYLDLFGHMQPPIQISADHADGWSDWLHAQAKHLRNRNFNALDADILAEELESLARADQRKLKSHLKILLLHLLKWQLQPSLRTASWQVSIGAARDEIEEVLEENPSFENRFLSEFVKEQYPRAVGEAARETGLGSDQFPPACPYSVDQLRDPQFLPE